MFPHHCHFHDHDRYPENVSDHFTSIRVSKGSKCSSHSFTILQNQCFQPWPNYETTFIAGRVEGSLPNSENEK
jgi:hypothetical protein